MFHIMYKSLQLTVKFSGWGQISKGISAIVETSGKHQIVTQIDILTCWQIENEQLIDFDSFRLLTYWYMLLLFLQ